MRMTLRASVAGPGPGRIGAALLVPFFAFTCALTFMALASPASAAAPYLVERNGRSAEVPTRMLARREVFDLGATARFLGLDLRRDRKRIELYGEQGSMSLQIGRSQIQVNGQALLLGSEVEVEAGTVWVPLDFLTRAIPRFLDEEVRHDGRARSIRWDAKVSAIVCERFDDRTRITVQVGRSGASPDVSSEGNRRVITLRGVTLPQSSGGCEFDETLTDLQVAPGDDGSRITLFTGPRFGGLEVREVPADSSLVIDVLRLAELPPELDPPVDASAPAAPAGNESFDTVVIDPGHGGEDRGAMGKGGLAEKDLVLSLAQELAASLRAAGLRVILTRNGDHAVPLGERTEIANRERADLFVSLHANAAPAREAWGAETYFLHLDATDEAARSLAALENDATGLRARGGAGGDLEMLLWDMAQQQYLDESSRLADTVQRELNALLGTRDRGVKQANFLVLRGATMPAILVEVGFLSNPAEETRMRGKQFQTGTAQALSRAILAFRDARHESAVPQ